MKTPKQSTTNLGQTAKAVNRRIANQSYCFYNQPMRKISDIFSFPALVIIFVTLFASCANSGDSNANRTAANVNQANTDAANSNTATEDIMELVNKVRLPELPEENVWREENGEKAKRKITAVLKYTPEAAARLVELVEKRALVAEAEIGTEDWFPEELVAQSQISGNESLKVDSYAANDFYNEPYSQGKLSRVKGTDYFVLELTTP